MFMFKFIEAACLPYWMLLKRVRPSLFVEFKSGEFNSLQIRLLIDSIFDSPF